MVDLRDCRKRAVFDGVEITTKPHRQAQKTARRDPVQQPVPSASIEEVPDEDPSSSTMAEPSYSNPSTPEALPPLHPYANVRDATTAGDPKVHDYAYRSGQAPKPPAPSPRTVAYHNVLPVADPEAEERVWQRNFVEARSIQLTPTELFSLAPGLCKRVHRATGMHRVATENPSKAAPVAASGGDPLTAWAPFSDELEGSLETSESFAFQGVFSDTYLPAESEESGVVVSAAVQKLRPAWVNDSSLVECILDPGSQIVAINADMCYRLGIAYDERNTIPMTTANGTENRMKGLTENVPLLFAGGITVWLQMHVVENAAYDILLGRPFDVLTSCVVRNIGGGRQEVVLTCPNTHKTLTLPTYARGESPRANQPPPGFRTSRI
ncbi:hypothetical protein L226DRAFT_473549 [Lentinus tigrinus ALCF2SS1-7]|uniref:uncharacterized protein n=1 Tax=Lentinus tigrinus ALCF2SS1-7 TaxID=1328758 RepID=UPI0011663145|nr:hypothetical protein L226DRAFT_473549 [Lentinus tigrinus ALCF2SS1-7]